jgi:large conductance mechanosensitive channel
MLPTKRIIPQEQTKSQTVLAGSHRMGMLSEFKEFAMRGNVMDLAVGIVIGGAFGKIVTSLVNDVVMPPIGLLLSNVDFSNLAVTIRQATEETPAVSIRYGQFLNTVIDFVIVAFVIFMVVKQLNRLSQPAPLTATTKMCPYCQMSIPITAVRCGHCTSELKVEA